NPLSKELVLCEAHGDAVQTWATFAAAVVESMAVAALFRLEHERSLSLQRGRAAEQALRYRIAAPGVHVRTPRRVAGEMRERAERDGNQHHGQYRNGPSLPALLAFAGEKRQQEQRDDRDDRPDEKRWRFERRRQQREQLIQPEKEVVGLWDGLDDRRIGPPGGTEGAEVPGACPNTEQDERREEHILPDGIRHER